MGKKNTDKSSSFIRYYCPCGESILIPSNLFYKLNDDDLGDYLERNCPKFIFNPDIYDPMFDRMKKPHTDPGYIEDNITGLDDIDNEEFTNYFDDIFE